MESMIEKLFKQLVTLGFFHVRRETYENDKYQVVGHYLSEALTIFSRLECDNSDRPLKMAEISIASSTYHHTEEFSEPQMEEVLQLLIDSLSDPSALPGVKPSLYIPQPHEPSPFGPHQEGYLDNDWISWKRHQSDYRASVSGSAPLLREALLEQLRDEKYRSQVDRELVPFELQTSNGKLSLGYVIHMRYSRQMDWEEAHAFGLNKIKELNQTR